MKKFEDAINILEYKVCSLDLSAAYYSTQPDPRHAEDCIVIMDKLNEAIKILKNHKE